jgi:hypothetical protein
MTLAAMLLCIAALGCKSTTKIGDLLDDPSRFENQTVSIAGDVKEAVGILGYGAYRVDDGTGVLTVIAQGGGAPRTGAKVGVEGEFRSAFTVGTESIAVLMEKRRYEP